MKNLKIIYISLVLSSLLYGLDADVSVQNSAHELYLKQFPEYKKDYKYDPNMTVMNIHKVREEYQNITGEDVVVGILEGGFNENHPSLWGKHIQAIRHNPCWDKSNCAPYDADSGARLGFAHGNHVAGIILGAKLPQNEYTIATPYGIAYNAMYHGVSSSNPQDIYIGNFYDEFKDKPQIKIINNSWAYELYPLINRYDARDHGHDFKGHKELIGRQSILKGDTTLAPISAQRYFELIYKDMEKSYFKPNGGESELIGLYKLSKERKVLNIFGAGNFAAISPSAAAVLPSYDESIRSWLVVGALNTHTTDANGMIKTRYVEKDESGKITIKRMGDTDGLLLASNHFKGPASLYAVTTPGQYIASSNAYFEANRYNPQIQANEKNQILDCVDASSGDASTGHFCLMSGTSMATPMASGVAALIQEQFPFMNGAQIADTILTTANSNIQAPKLIVKSFINGTKYQDNKEYMIIYISDSTSDVQDEKGLIPTKDGDKTTIDIEQVKKDLWEFQKLDPNKTTKPAETHDNAYTQDIIKKLAKSKDDLNIAPEKNFEAITQLTREEVFGQGIVDAHKALGGIARLDANRLNLEDIQDFQEIPQISQAKAAQIQALQPAPSNLRQVAQPLDARAQNTANNADSHLSQQEQERKNLISSTKQAFYTLDTTTNNPASTFVFSNNIDQRLWQDRYHVKDALNSPWEQMQYITKVGLIKKGSGTLVLSGVNTYEGATRVQDGVLEITGKLTESNAYAEGNGILKLTGSNQPQETQPSQKAQQQPQPKEAQPLALIPESQASQPNQDSTKSQPGANQASQTQLQEAKAQQASSVTQTQQDSTSTQAMNLITKNAIARDNGSMILHKNVTVGNLYAENKGVIYAFDGSASSATISKGGVLIVSNEVPKHPSNTLLTNQAITQQAQNTNSTNLKLLSNSNPSSTDGNLISQSGTLTLESGGILAGNGKLQGDVQNKSGIVMAGFVPENMAHIDTNKTLTIDGSYTQGAQGSLHILYSSSDTTNTQIQANNYALEGNLVFVPTYVDGLSVLKANQEIAITTADHNAAQPNNNQQDNTQPLAAKALVQESASNINHGQSNNSQPNTSFQAAVKQAIEQNNLTVKTLSSNLFDITFDKEKFKLKVQAKDNPFNLDSKNTDPNLSNVLQSIFTADNLSKDYEDVIGRLDMNANSKQFNDTIEEIIDSSNLQTQEALYLGQSSSMFENLNFTLSNATALVGIKNNVRLAALSTKQRYAQLLANTSTRSDAYYLPLIQMHSNSRAQILTQFNSSKLKAKSYAANSYALNVQVKSILTQGLLLGGFIDIDNTQANFKNANVKANTFSIGGNAILSIGDYFDIISSLSAGYGVNKEQRHYSLLNQNLEGNYNSYYAMAQIGVGKNIYLHKKLVVKPMLLMQYNIINNSAYSQSKALFAKSYDSSAYDTLASSLGAHLGVNALDSKSFKVYINAFGFYTYRLNTDLSSNVRFSDFSDKSFIQKENIDRTSIYIGANIGTYYKNYFLQLGFSTQRAESYVRETLNVTLGLEF